jgi:hypothetical protein
VKSQGDIDAKWEAVKKHYESFYRVRFKEKPADSKIEFLYKSMLEFQDSWGREMAIVRRKLESQHLSDREKPSAEYLAWYRKHLTETQKSH